MRPRTPTRTASQTTRQDQETSTTVAVKIKLKRIGKIRNPHYRIVVADARTKRDGRAIEEIGKYHPKEDPSLIEVNSERAQYWLGVGAQPTEAVRAILKVTGDWQTFKGEPAPEPMQVARPRPTSAPLRGRGQGRRCGRPEADRSRRPRSLPPKRRRPTPPRRAGSRGTADAAEAADGRRGARLDRHLDRERLSVLEEALEHLVKGIVEHPDDVAVRDRALRRGRVLEVRVHPDDLGKVIGRAGRTAKALRTVVGAHRRPASLSASTSSTSTSADPRACWPVLVVVGRIGRAHGIRGEVTVEVRTDEPERRFAPGAVLVTDPGDRARSRSLPAGCTAAGCCCVSRVSTTARAPRRSADTLLLADVDPDELPADEDECYDHQLVGLDAVRPDGGAARRGRARSSTCPARTCSSISRPTAPRSWSRSCARSSPRSTSRPAGSSSTRRPACSRTAP